MILAAPLVIPFAEAVGISIASLGMAKAADMVNEYIQENPEQSVKILSTIVPNVGIGQIFANKEDSDELAGSIGAKVKAGIIEELYQKNYLDLQEKNTEIDSLKKEIKALKVWISQIL